MTKLTKARKDYIANCAETAQRALDVVGQGDDETAVYDLITHLLHYAVGSNRRDREAIAQRCIDSALMHFHAEQNGDE